MKKHYISFWALREALLANASALATDSRHTAHISARKYHNRDLHCGFGTGLFQWIFQLEALHDMYKGDYPQSVDRVIMFWCVPAVNTMKMYNTNQPAGTIRGEFIASEVGHV